MINTPVHEFGITTHMAYNKFEHTLTFKHSLFGHFAKEANEIWFPGKPVNAPPRYQI